MFKRIKRQATDWGKISAKDTSDKRPLSKIHKELLNKKTNNPIKKMGQRHFTEEDIQMANKHI